MNAKQGILFVLSSPSGGGKSSLARALLNIEPNLILSISITTRPKRNDEVDGVDYYFKSVAEFERLISDDLIFEYTKIYNHYYGTLKASIMNAVSKNISILFDINSNGMNSLKSFKNMVSVFLIPPSIQVLRQRLVKRGQDTLKEIEKRIQAASDELKYADQYDYNIINKDFDCTLKQIQSIFNTEIIKSNAK